ncbi:carbohydrate ABC transporter permease [Cytobacillus firmus]|jgi:multiple sugar transport system permease protein/putative aldouronate transport system permease protein|uniref:carbohydrate ABC transporter permease n=1 Tax=Paenibacillus lautus TaxID=1401 RepID=UPI0010EC61F7|nr:carbohydrate ABC transporter permease [Paenibacillus lautus]MBY0163739.1 carbohydrate ABC transporter permease [Cytobacillus firmus]MCI1774005.1 carbohydrate ABC transporter permease [Paenibacillus lautus]VTR20492.1 maltose transporter permease [Actinobacillus pleuropneumoniae]
MIKRSTGEIAFEMFNYIFLAVVSAAMIFPILHVAAQSLSSDLAISRGDVGLWPVEFTLSNYAIVLNDTSVWRSFMISVFVTVVGTGINLIATASLAYPLSRNEYRGRKVILMLVLITFIFSAPLIPNYLLIKSLNMLDTVWALIIPGAISAYNLFIMRSFFMNLPNEIIDSARIDGCGELRIISSIVLPLSKPVMATMGLFYAVAHWNSYSSALYYINSRKLFPLQVRLREIVITDQMGEMDTTFENLANMSPEGIKMATIVIATLPIILVYPFLQKYFIKGMLIGSIKS